MASKKQALFVLFIVSLFWSTSGPLTKILYKSFDPFSLAFLRFFLASIFMLPFFIRKNTTPFKEIVKNIAPITFLSVGNIFFFYIGIKTTTVVSSSVIYADVPMLMLIFSKIILSEKILPRKFIGILIGLIGTIYITFLPALNRGQNINGDLIGNLLILTATFSWSAYSIGSRILTHIKGYSVYTITSVSFFINAIVFGILTLMTKNRPLLPEIFKIDNFILLIILALVPTVFTNVFYQWAVKHLSATTASLNTYLQPVFSIILAMIFLGEKINMEFILGSLIIIIGVAITTGISPSKLVNSSRLRPS